MCINRIEIKYNKNRMKNIESKKIIIDEDEEELEVEKETEGGAEKEAEHEIENKIEDEIEQKVEQKIEDEIEQKIEDKIENKIEQKIEQEIEHEIEDKIENKLEDKIENKIVHKTEQKIGQKVVQKVVQKIGQKIGQKIEQKVGQKTGQKIEQKKGQKIGHKIEDKIERKLEKGIEHKIKHKIKHEIKHEIKKEIKKEIKHEIKQEIEDEIEKEEDEIGNVIKQKMRKKRDNELRRKRKRNKSRESSVDEVVQSKCREGNEKEKFSEKVEKILDKLNDQQKGEINENFNPKFNKEMTKNDFLEYLSSAVTFAQNKWSDEDKKECCDKLKEYSFFIEEISSPIQDLKKQIFLSIFLREEGFDERFIPPLKLENDECYPFEPIPFSYKNNAFLLNKKYFSELFSGQVFIQSYCDILNKAGYKLNQTQVKKKLDSVLKTLQIYFAPIGEENCGLTLFNGNIFINSNYLVTCKAKHQIKKIQGIASIILTLSHELIEVLARDFSKEKRYFISYNPVEVNDEVTSNLGDAIDWLLNFKRSRLYLSDSLYFIDKDSYNTTLSAYQDKLNKVDVLTLKEEKHTFIFRAISSELQWNNYVAPGEKLDFEDFLSETAETEKPKKAKVKTNPNKKNKSTQPKTNAKNQKTSPKNSKKNTTAETQKKQKNPQKKKSLKKEELSKLIEKICGGARSITIQLVE